MVNRRGEVSQPVPALGVFIDSFDLVLRVNDKSERTREMYADVVRWFAGWLTEQGVRDWASVGKDELRAFFLYLKDLGYAQSYRNNIGRCLQAFHKFLAEEEELPNPFAVIKPPPPPKLGDNPPPVMEDAAMDQLIADAEKGRDFQSRRDAALLHMFRSTGCRLGEITDLRLTDLDLKQRTARVTGKGGKSRTVKYDHKTALALDRYQRVRAAHPAADLPALWLGVKRRIPMTRSGIRRAIVRRAKTAGLKVWPHLFRHTFAHEWLDREGSEGDLMELTGWESAQMLKLYGRSARGARARRAYDRIMGG